MMGDAAGAMASEGVSAEDPLMPPEGENAESHREGANGGDDPIEEDDAGHHDEGDRDADTGGSDDETRPDVPVESTIFMTELMASNEMTIADEADEYDDWIELHNAGPVPVDLTGWGITDAWAGGEHPMGFPPGIVLGPGGYLLLWADKDTAQGPLYLDLRIFSGGEVLTLVDDRGVLIDEVASPPLEEDTVYARRGTTDDWFISNRPTPGEPNP
jgi:hypothetical protein